MGDCGVVGSGWVCRGCCTILDDWRGLGEMEGEEGKEEESEERSWRIGGGTEKTGWEERGIVD